MKNKPRPPKPGRPLAVEEPRSQDALPYSSFHVQDFRGIRELTVEPLPRVNLIIGENNAGKTALLEAIFVHSAPFNPMVVTSVAGLRGMGTYKIEFGRMVQRPWISLFRDLDESRQIRLSARDTNGHTRTLVIKTTTDPKDVAQARSKSTHPIPNGQGTASSSARIEILRWHYSGSGREEISLLFLDGTEPRTDYPGRFIGSRWIPNFAEIADQFGELEIEKRAVRQCFTLTLDLASCFR
jgi:AAA domain